MNGCEHVRMRSYPFPVSTVHASDCPCLTTLALQCARRAGVPQQLREDCAQDFLLHFFTLRSRSERQQESEHRTIFTRAWLHRSARNYAIDVLRHQSVLRQHEVEIPEDEFGHSLHFISSSDQVTVGAWNAFVIFYIADGKTADEGQLSRTTPVTVK